jgi:DNA-binding PadR family transcriptional regulator
MFERLREFHEEHRCHGHEEHRHRRGGFGDHWEEFGRGFGRGGRERLFDNGHLKLLILQLIADKPSHGYELMKAIEERMAGGYTPSPGVVYPTLTLLEEEGLAEVSATEGSKKLYAATAEGREHLKQNQVILKAILGRVENAGRHFGRSRSPQLERATMNLKLALKLRMSRGEVTPEQIARLAEILDGAARAIDEA